MALEIMQAKKWFGVQMAKNKQNNYNNNKIRKLLAI